MTATDESNIGLVLWLVLFIEVNVTWILMDVWLRAKNHEYLTTEVKEILSRGGFQGLGFAALVGAMFGIIYYHFFYQ